MTTTPPVAFQIHPIPSKLLDDVRAAGIDVSGYPIEHVVADGGEPLRCCLRNARPGEATILFGYEPPLPVSPYREIGPVFAHAQPCAGPVDGGDYPSEWRGRPQILRAYDHRGWMHDATSKHDGKDPETVIGAMLADPAIAQIHSRNVIAGCYMFSITRSDGSSSEPNAARR